MHSSRISWLRSDIPCAVQSYSVGLKSPEQTARPRPRSSLCIGHYLFMG